jgi:hypothetical protein
MVNRNSHLLSLPMGQALSTAVSLARFCCPYSGSRPWKVRATLHEQQENQAVRRGVVLARRLPLSIAAQLDVSVTSGRERDRWGEPIPSTVTRPLN